MDLFSLVAKLTLDSSQYDRDISRIENQDIDIGEATVSVDTSDFEEGMQSAGDSAETFGSRSEKAFEGIKTALTATGIMAVVGKLASVMTKAVNSTAEMGDRIDKSSKRMGISTRMYQEWDHALEMSGGGVDDLTRGLKTFRGVIASADKVTQAEIDTLERLHIATYDEEKGRAKTREELKNEVRERLAVTQATEENKEAITLLNGFLEEGVELTDDQADAFRRLNINPEQYSDASQLMEDVLYKLAEYSDLNKDINERDTIVDALFGRNSGGIKPLLDEGTKGMRELVEEADKLGIVMTDEDIQNAVEYSDSVQRLNDALDGLQAKFVELILPTLTEAVDMVTSIISFFNGGTYGQSLTKRMYNLDKQFDSTISKIEGTADTAKTLVEKLDEISKLDDDDATKKQLWAETVDKLLKTMPELSKYIDDETMSLKTNKEEIGKVIDEYERLAKQKAFQDVKEKKYEELVEGHKEALEAEIDYTVKVREAERQVRKAVDDVNDRLEKAGLSDLKIELSDEKWTTENYQEKLAELEESEGFKLYGKEALKVDTGLRTSTGNPVTDLAINILEARNKAEDFKDELEEMENQYNDWVEAGEAVYLKSEKSVEDQRKAVLDLKKATDDAVASANRLWNEFMMLDGKTTMHGGVKMYYNAAGQWDVPTDDYPTLLHRDEMVLTASQARRYREGEGGNIDYNRLEEAIISSIRAGMDGATVNSYLDSKPITDAVSRELAGQMQGRRFGW